MYAAIVTGLARWLWGWRVELALTADVVVLLVCSWHVSPGLGTVTAVALCLLALGPGRRRLLGTLRNRRSRRRWEGAVRVAGGTAHRQRVPVILASTSTPVGERLRVRVPAGSRVSDLEASRDAIAAALGARDLRVTRDRSHAARADVLVVRRDPLIERKLPTWPLSDSLQTSLWGAIPVGVGEDGVPITMRLPERNVLLGGEPGAGKSAAMSLLVATAALDPTCELWLLDGKLVELSTWAPCARGSAGVDVDEAIDVLRGLRREMDARYAELLSLRRRKVERDSGLPLHVVVCDELAHYLTTGDRKQRAEFADLMRDLVSRGRAAGIIVLAATQKPSSDIIPTSLRDLFGFRWALRCATPQASDTILGSGWSSAGFSAAEIDAAHRGIGYLLHEGGEPVRLRSYYLDDAAIQSLATRAEALRTAVRTLEVTP